jgi:hypothetical protein
MNCDQAFDCLTDPGRRHSPQLEEHLARCARCRQMMDTLEPALDLFDELVPEPDLSGRTATRTLAPESVRVAEQAASRLVATGAEAPLRRRNSALRYAAAAMVGALLMGLMGSINKAHSPAMEGSAETAVPDVEASKCPWELKTFDRSVYPTRYALAVACMKCHPANGTPIDAGAQPISIEMLPDLSASVDSLIRELRARETWSMSTAIAIVPRNRRAASTSLLCAVAVVAPRTEQIV